MKSEIDDQAQLTLDPAGGSRKTSAPKRMDQSAPSPGRNSSFPIHPTSAVIYVLLLIYFLIVVYPMFWLLYSSFKTDQQIFLSPFSLPTHLHGENYAHAWVGGHFHQYLINSIIITLTTVVVTTFMAAMVSYALARFEFPLAKPIFYYFLAGLMIPVQLAIVPLFFMLKGFHMLDSLQGLFLVYLAFGFPFSVFILTGFFKSLPVSLHESALLDGATELQAFRLVMLPLAKAGLITVAIFLFIGNWNEFYVAFMILSGKGSTGVRTLPLGVADITIVANYRSDWGMAFAGLVLMMLPPLVGYIFLQKHLTKGITAGAIKG